MSTSIQNVNKDNPIVDPPAVISVTAVATSMATQQLSSISLMLEYDIDNTLNTIKENGVHLKEQQQQAKNANSLSTVQAKIQSVLTMASNDLCSPKQSDTPSTVVNDKPLMPTIPPVTVTMKNTARKRWKMLAKVLRKDPDKTSLSSDEHFSEEQMVSVRRFKSFDLLRQDSFDDHISLNCLGKTENWFKYSILLNGEGQQEYNVNIHHVDRQLTASDLIGFNNTGNICVWPSEEALAAYVLSDLTTFRGKWILELGGGFTCLAGLMLSKYAKPYAVHLTDGNQVSVDNVRNNICLNKLSCYTKCSVLKWEDVGTRSPAEAGKFDAILSADCLFFDDARTSLVETLWYYLDIKGEALIMAPRRGKTMMLFVNECTRKGFIVEIIQRYNEIIWKRHEHFMTSSSFYDEDLHYPLLLRLRKPARG